jgi:AcrR family transcriptional regulator
MRNAHKVAVAESGSRQQRRTEQTRGRLLEAALAVFVEKGYDGASLGEITKRADLGTGTYYLHFPDKRSIYEAVVRRNVRALQHRWLAERTARKVDGKPDSEISLMVEMVLADLLEDTRLARLVLLDGPPLETWLVEEIGREMAGVLGDGVSEPELVANLVIGVTLTAGRWALTRRRSVPPKRLLAAAIAFCRAGVASASAVGNKRRA